jgi:dienelactone hydrolase
VLSSAFIIDDPWISFNEALHRSVAPGRFHDGSTSFLVLVGCCALPYDEASHACEGIAGRVGEGRPAGGVVMRAGYKLLAWKSFGAMVALASIVGISLAQAPRQPARNARGQGRNQGAPPKKARPEAGDPLAKAAGLAAKPASGAFHYNFRLRSFDGTPLAASFYPAKSGGSSAPVVMLIHETGRSRKDFEDAVQDLKGQGLAAHLQDLGYAVFTMDLRWQGQNPRKALTADERPKFMEDLQAGYIFLVDRHNRGDLNVAKLGVIGLGDGANLVANWAFQPGAAVSLEGHPADLSAVVLISPNPDGFGYVLGHVVASLAPRVPLMLLAGERDNPSKDAVTSVKQVVQRARLNKVELFPSSLHGYKLLRLEPKVVSSLFGFLDTTLKNRPVEWEPEYNLTPVTFGDPQVVANSKEADNTKEQAAAKKPAAAKPKAEEAKKPEPKKAAAP